MKERQLSTGGRHPLGIPTASQFHRIFTEKGNPAPATANTYRWQLVAERIFEAPFSPDLSRIKAVQDGVANEPLAREALSRYLRYEVEPADFQYSQDRRFGCSPDGWVGNRPVEIKCPQLPGHLELLTKPPRKHWPQIQGQMLVTDADQVEFWSWSPYAPAAYYQIPRDVGYCNSLHYHLTIFCNELDNAEGEVRQAGKFDLEAFKASLQTWEADEEDANA
jgi:hypothetical protein